MQAIVDHQQELTHKLAQAAEKGLSRAKLLGSGKAKAAREEVLAELLASGKAIDIGTAKSPKFVLVENDRRLENTCAAVEAKALPGVPRACREAQLFKGVKAAADIRARALESLLRGGRLVRMQSGAKWDKALFVHAAALPPLPTPASEMHAARDTPAGTMEARAEALPAIPATPPNAETRENFEVEVRAAYAALARESGFADVLISELQARAGVPLGTLQPWLLEASRRGAVLPGRGDWSLASEAARRAAISVRGEPHLRVRFA